MAEGSINSMATSEKNDLNGGKICSEISTSLYNGGKIYSQHRRESIGSYDAHARHNKRRVSMEKKLDSGNNSQVTTPHYLRASTGSCHDFCKYGRKHEFEAKERRKRTAKPPPNEQNSVEKTIPGEIIVNHKASSGNKSHLPVVKFFTSKPQTSLDTQTNSPEQKASPDNIKKGGRKLLASKASVKKTLTPLPASVSPKLSLYRTMSLKTRKTVSLKLMSAPLKEKNRAVGSEDRDGTPEKLKFMRRKAVDLKSDNNNPRKLGFRRGRVISEDQDGKGDLRRKNDADPSSEKVILKHQDVKGKKDAQGLFNTVIEETASKLVESRKSKVKALVGAFETVISLQ